MRVVRGVIVVLALVLIGTVVLVCLNAQEPPGVARSPADAPFNLPMQMPRSICRHMK